MKAKKMLIPLVIASLSSMMFSSHALAETFSGKANVYRVVDGDTFIVNVKDKTDYFQFRGFAKKHKDGLKFFNDKYLSFRIRLANTDTAESVHTDKSRNSEAGKQASDYSKGMLTGKNIDYKCWDMGKYNRAICSISLDGKDYGITLIENGYSEYVTKFGKHPYLHKEYKNAVRK